MTAGVARNPGCPSPGCKEVFTADFVASRKVEKVTEKLVDALKVFCPNKKNGCKWGDERNSLRRHLDEGCKSFLCGREGCKELFSSAELARHLCPLDPVACPQQCGAGPILRSAVVEHVAGPCAITVARRAEEARIAAEAEAARVRADQERRLKEAKAANESAVRAMMESTAKWASLDIRGTQLKTSLSTLCKFPESLLAQYATRAFAECEGVIRIDRDPDTFRALVHWLATDDLPVSTLATDHLRREGVFWKIQVPEVAPPPPQTAEYVMLARNLSYRDYSVAVIYADDGILDKYNIVGGRWSRDNGDFVSFWQGYGLLLELGFEKLEILSPGDGVPLGIIFRKFVPKVEKLSLPPAKSAESEDSSEDSEA